MAKKAAAENAVLLDPDGVEYVPGSAVEANNLIASGYRPKSGDPDAAVAAAGQAPVESAGTRASTGKAASAASK